MKGLILKNAYYDAEAPNYQSRRLWEELKSLGVETEIKKNDFFGAEIAGGKIKKLDGDYAFCVYFDKDKYVSQALEKEGLRLFNRHAAIRVCDDKAETFLALAGSGTPMPQTLPGLLCYTGGAAADGKTYDYIEEKLGYPLVVKECYGSLGKGVYRADNRKQLEALGEKLMRTPHLFQKYVAESAGKDVRVICVGGKAVAAMKRVSLTDFRSNIELGGRGENYAIDGDLRAIAEKTAKVLGLDYCGIDLLFGKDGYLVCEVNSNAFFGGTERATGVNVAGLYAKHIYDCAKRGV